MNVSLIPIMYFVVAVVAFVLTIFLYRLYRRDQTNKVLEYFSKAFAMMIPAFVFFSLPWFFIPDQSYYLGVALIIGYIFFFISFAYLTMTTTFFIDPVRHRVAFFLFITMSTVVTLLLLVYFRFPLFDPDAGIFSWNIDPIARSAAIVLSSMVLIPSALYFFVRSAKGSDRIVKTRSMLLGTGFFVFCFSVITLLHATSAFASFIASGLTVAALLIIFPGVYYKRTHQTQSYGT